jgi:hypothetical protein
MKLKNIYPSHRDDDDVLQTLFLFAMYYDQIIVKKKIRIFMYEAECYYVYIPLMFLHSYRNNFSIFYKKKYKYVLKRVVHDIKYLTNNKHARQY